MGYQIILNSNHIDKYSELDNPLYLKQIQGSLMVDNLVGSQDSSKDQSNREQAILTKTRITEIWTQNQDNLLFSIYKKYGPRWSYASKFIHKKVNAIKNRFYGKIRKLERRLIFVGKKLTKVKKNMNYAALIRPLEAKFTYQPYQNCYLQIQFLKSKILQYSCNQPQNLNVDFAEELIDRIHKFNLLTRSYKFIDQKNTTENSIKQTKNEVNMLKSFKQKFKDKKNVQSDHSKGTQYSYSSTQLNMMSSEQIQLLYFEFAELERNPIEEFDIQNIQQIIV